MNRAARVTQEEAALIKRFDRIWVSAQITIILINSDTRALIETVNILANAISEAKEELLL